MENKYKTIKIFVISVFCFIAGIFLESTAFLPQTVQAAAEKGTVLEQGKQKSIQLDGKGAKEKIAFTMENTETEEKDDFDKPYFRHTLTLTINGNAVLEENVTNMQNEATGDVYIIDLDQSDRVKDIFVAIYTKPYVSKYDILYYCQYKNGKFEKIQDLGKYLYSGALDCFGESHMDNCHVWYEGLQGSMRTEGNKKLQIMVCLNTEFSNESWGYVHGMFSLKLKNGKLKKAEANPQGEIIETDFGGELAAKCTFYAQPGSTKKAFSCKKGETVTISGYKLVKNKLYLKAVNKDKTVGWCSGKNIFKSMGTLHA